MGVSDMSNTPSKPSSGAIVSHLVLTVRDIEATHRFYTEILGFEQCGDLKGDLAKSAMRFYRGTDDTHHSIAFVQAKDPASAPEEPKWEGFFPDGPGLNHFALAYPSREAFLAQLAHMKAKGVEFVLRVNHGMTHSVYVSDPDGNGVEVLYDLPAEVWESDVNAALNYVEALPTDGPGALEDSVDYTRFSPTHS